MSSLEDSVTLAEAGRALNLSLLDAATNPTLLQTSTGYTYPLPVTPEYRGWYRITSGANAGKALWAPKKSKFLGPRTTGPHKGADLFALNGTEVRAVTRGTIEWRPFSATWGNHIYLYHTIDGVTHIIVFAHLEASGAFSGTKDVEAGVRIGTVGCTGNAGNSGTCWRDAKCNGKFAVEDHLHLELLVLGPGGDVVDRKDPVATFGWTVAYADDQSETICGTQHQLVPA